MFLTFLLISRAQVAAMAVVGAIFYGLGNYIASIIPPLITSEIYSQDCFGQAYGYVQAATNLGMATGSLLVASLAMVVGYATAWKLIAVLCLVFGALWLLALQQAGRRLAKF